MYTSSVNGCSEKCEIPKSKTQYKRVSDCCLTPNEKIFSYVIEKIEQCLLKYS